MAEGRVAVLEPPAGYDLPFGPDRAVILSTSAPAAARWGARGYEVVPSMPEADHALVVVPRAREFARGLVAMAARVPGQIAVDGQKTDGIEGLFRDLKARAADAPGCLSRDHGRLVWLAAAPDVEGWGLAGPAPGPEGWQTQPGVFSHGKIDAGSALLAAALPAKLPRHVVDLGAGWGFLTAAILSRSAVERVDGIEAEARALDCARRNVTDPRAHWHWADALSWAPEDRLQPRPGAVVMNPPFHEGRRGAPDLGRGFIAAAARLLGTQGTLYMVANRHLPYEADLRERFREVEEMPGSGAFKLFAAHRPHAASAPGRGRGGRPGRPNRVA